MSSGSSKTCENFRLSWYVWVELRWLLIKLDPTFLELSFFASRTRWSLFRGDFLPDNYRSSLQFWRIKLREAHNSAYLRAIDRGVFRNFCCSIPVRIFVKLVFMKSSVSRTHFSTSTQSNTLKPTRQNTVNCQLSLLSIAVITLVTLSAFY